MKIKTEYWRPLETIKSYGKRFHIVVEIGFKRRMTEQAWYQLLSYIFPINSGSNYGSHFPIRFVYINSSIKLQAYLNIAVNWSKIKSGGVTNLESCRERCRSSPSTGIFRQWWVGSSWCTSQWVTRTSIDFCCYSSTCRRRAVLSRSSSFGCTSSRGRQSAHGRRRSSLKPVVSTFQNQLKQGSRRAKSLDTAQSPSH